MGKWNVDVKFHPVDYVVFILMFCLSLGIGLWSGLRGRKEQTTAGYLMGDRNLGLLPVTLSITGKFLQGAMDLM